MLDTGCSVLDTGYSILDAGYSISLRAIPDEPEKLEVN
jgi:hypothetical protein